MSLDSIKTKPEMKIKDKVIFIAGIIIIFGAIVELILFLLGIGHSIPLKFTFKNIHWVFFEIGITIFGLLIVVFMLQRYLERKKPLTRDLLWVCVMYISSMAAQVYTKIVKYIIVDQQIYPVDSYLYGLLWNFRFTSLFSGMAGLFFYAFYIEVFVQKDKETRGKKGIIIFSIIAIGCQLLPSFDDRIFQTGIMSLILIQAMIIYVPIAVNAYRMVRRSSWESGEIQLFYGFLFLWILAIAFICIWISYVISIVADIITDGSYGPFYVAMQIFVIILLIGIYLGFIMPEWFKRFLDKRQKAVK